MHRPRHRGGPILGGGELVIALAEVGARLRLQGADRYRRDADKAADATGRMGKSAGRAERSLQSLNAQMNRAAKAGAIGLAVGAVGAGTALFKMGEQFNDAFRTIRVGTGATGAALKGLQGDFKAVLAAVPTDMESAATAIADLNTRTGLSGAALQDLTKNMLEMTRLTGGDLSANIASTTRLFGDWGVAQKDQAGTLDKLFRASQATGIGIDALASSAVQFGAPLRAMGFGLDETAALLGKFEKEGVNGELVMGAFRKGLAKFAKDGEDAPKALARLTREIKGAKTPTLGTAKAMAVFGSKAGPDMAAAIREGRFEVADLLKTVSDGDETILGAAKATEAWGQKWQRIKNKVLVGLEPLATGVFDAVVRAADRFAVWMDETGTPAVQKFADEFKKGTGQGGKFRDRMKEIGEKLRDAYPYVKDTFDKLAEFVKWMIDHETAVKNFAIAIAGLAVAVKAVAVAGALAAAVKWAGLATGITTVGAAAGAAGAAQTGGLAMFAARLAPLYAVGGPVLLATAALGGLYWALKRANDSASNTASTVAGLPTATTGTQIDPNKPIPGLTFNGKPVPGGGRPGVEIVTNTPTPSVKPRSNRTASHVGSAPAPAAGPLVIHNYMTVDGKVLANNTKQVFRDEAARR